MKNESKPKETLLSLKKIEKTKFWGSASPPQPCPGLVKPFLFPQYISLSQLFSKTDGHPICSLPSPTVHIPYSILIQSWCTSSLEPSTSLTNDCRIGPLVLSHLLFIQKTLHWTKTDCICGCAFIGLLLFLRIPAQLSLPQ